MSASTTKVRLRRSLPDTSGDEPRKSARIVARSHAEEPIVPTREDVARMGNTLLDKLMAIQDARDDALLCDPFFKLPSRKQYPEYYVVIKRPLSFAEMRQKLRQREYATFQDVKQDLELMCTNAKRFNMRDSDIWLKARDLQAIAKELSVSVYDEWHEAAAEQAEVAEAVTQRPETQPARSHKITLRAPRSSGADKGEGADATKAYTKTEAPAQPRQASPVKPEPVQVPAKIAAAAPEGPAQATTVQPPHAPLAQTTVPSPVPAQTSIPRGAPTPQSPVAVHTPMATRMMDMPSPSLSVTPTTTSYVIEPRRRGAPRGKRLKAMLRWAVQNMVAVHDPDGHAYSDMFMELPSREEYPDYYQFIQHPICFRDIERRLDMKEYINPHALVSDIRLMLGNAQFYNEEGSQVWNDAQALRQHLDKVLIPALLAEGFTLDPNDHRQAAVPPGKPGYVPPPSSVASTPTASTPVRQAPVQSPPSLPRAWPPKVQMPSVPSVPAPPSMPATPSVSSVPSVPAVSNVPAAPPAASISLEQVWDNLDAKVWPQHPAAFTAPTSCTTMPQPRHEAQPPWTCVHVCMQGPESAWQAQVSLRVDEPRARFALAMPHDTRAVQWRWDVKSRDVVHDMRVLVHGTAVHGEWDGSTYVVCTQVAPAIEAQWLDEQGTVCGTAQVYMRK